MSDYISSALLAYQDRINSKFNAHELRELKSPILKKAIGYSDLLMGKKNVNDVKESDKRAVSTYYLQRMAASNGTARAYAPTGVQSNSGAVSLSWVTFSETFGLFMQVGADNVFSDLDALDHQILEKQRILRERISLYIVQQLYNARTQTAFVTASNSLRNATWDPTNFGFTISSDDSTKFYQDVASVMRQQKYYEQFDVIADPIVYKAADFLRAQGAGNATNYSFQFQDFQDIMFHAILGDAVNGITTPYSGGSALVMPNAAFSLIPWIPKINRDGYGDSEDYNGSFATVADGDGVGVDYAVRAWTQKADGSANGAVVQTVQLQMELSLDIAFNAAPFSNAGESAIYLFGQS